MNKIIPMLSIAACLTNCHEIPKVEINENDTAVLCFKKDISYTYGYGGYPHIHNAYYFDTNNDGLIDCIVHNAEHDKLTESLIEYNFKNTHSYAYKDLPSYLEVIVMPQYQSKTNGNQLVSLTEANQRDSVYVFNTYSALLDVPKKNTTKRYLCKWDSKSFKTAAVCEALIYNMKNGATYSKEVIDSSFAETTEISRPHNITTNAFQIKTVNMNRR